jgi:hypothetical protein
LENPPSLNLKDDVVTHLEKPPSLSFKHDVDIPYAGSSKSDVMMDTMMKQCSVKLCEDG